jgi:hypothetical protein
VPAAPGIRRVTVANSGPFTFAGTDSYIVGSGRVAVIDPGPADASHFQALMAAADGAPVADKGTAADFAPDARPPLLRRSRHGVVDDRGGTAAADGPPGPAATFRISRRR